QVGRLLHQPFRGLLSVYSRYGLHARQVAYATFYTEGFSSFVASAAAPIATGWSEPVPGRDFPPAEDQRLFTAHWRGGLGGTYLGRARVRFSRFRSSFHGGHLPM